MTTVTQDSRKHPTATSVNNKHNATSYSNQQPPPATKYAPQCHHSWMQRAPASLRSAAQHFGKYLQDDTQPYNGCSSSNMRQLP